MTQRVVNYTYGTGNPVLPDGSIDVRDGIDNLQSMDVFMNAPEGTYNQRDGEIVRTVAGMNSEFDAQILNMGFTRVGTFAAGATLTNPRQTLMWDIADGGDGQEYGWSGAFQKVVPAASTPASTGGISVGAWISRFDPELRIQVREALRRSYAEAGYNVVGTFQAGFTYVNANDVGIDEDTGKGYTGPVGAVAAGTNPLSGGFVDVSGDFDRIENLIHVGFNIKNNLTDQTSNIVAFFSSLPSTEKTIFEAGPNIAFDAAKVVDSMPVGCALICNFAFIGNNTPSYTQKYCGILTKDSVNNDFVYTVESGHHPSIGLMNYRKSGTTSADEGLASMLYSLGRFSGGQQRNFGIWQWRKSPSSDVWVNSIRRLAPWVAGLHPDTVFELWEAGLSFSVGDYCKSVSKVYKAATSGTTGSAPPTHNSGTTSDGGVSWEYIANGDTTLYALDEFGRLGLNGLPSDSEQISFRQNIDDTSDAYVHALRARGTNVTVIERLYPTDGAGASIAVPFLRGYGSGYSQFEMSGGVPLLRFYGDRVEHWTTAHKSTSAPNGSATPSVANTRALVLNNSGLTTITDLVGGVEDQVVDLIFANANTTLAHGSLVRLTGSVSVTPSALSVITLRKVAAGAITSAWIEVSRSIK